jgi:hypothetical protein
MTKDSGAAQDNQIHELTEIYDERSGDGRRITDGINSQQIIMIDGRGYERVKPSGHDIHDLTEVIEDNPSAVKINDAIMKRAMEMVEKIAREVIPQIAERVIREEIGKIKGMSKDHSTERD